jgi:NADPH:quinone reductase-like Zn-dependent oxidoreductase
MLGCACQQIAATLEEKNMKAVRMHSLGGPQQLVYEDAEKPVLDPGDALVRVMASSITKDELTWTPTYQTKDGKARLPTIPGHEFSGVVEELAPDVKDVKVGEDVYGLASFYRNGSAAECLAVAAADLAPKPATLDFEQAASVPLAALTAWQALFDHGKLAANQRVLIQGAAGGVGAFAVQLAHWKGAHVVASASAPHAAFLRQIGADEIIDYEEQKFEEVVNGVDLVLDTVGGDVFERSKLVLSPTGKLITIVEAVPLVEDASLPAREIFFIVEPNRTELIEIGRLIDAGQLKATIAEVFPLDEAKKAFERGLAGHVRGKIVLRVANQARSSARA